jgi:hypothetical protein
MASREVLHRLARDIEAAGGEDAVFERVAAGEPMRRIMESFGVSRTMFYRWRDIEGKGSESSERRKLKMEEALKVSADAHAEDAGEILDTAGEDLALTSPGATIAQARAKYRQWLAGVRNRETFGDSPKAHIEVSIGGLHLDALRVRGRVEHEEPNELEGAVEEATVEVLPPAVQDTEDEVDPVLELLGA